MKAALLLVGAAGALLATAKDAIGNELLSRSGAWTAWDHLFIRYGRSQGVSPALLKAICWQESNLGREPSVVEGMKNPNDLLKSASYDKKSWGLMQVTLPTANRPRVRPGTTGPELNDAVKSVMIAVLILSEIKNYYAPPRTMPDEHLEFVIKAYNGGPGWKTSAAKNPDTRAMLDKYYAGVKKKLDYVLKEQPELA